MGNSCGRGKGLATYFKECKFAQSTSIKKEKFQLTKLSSPKLDIISIYRSEDSKLNKVAASFEKLIDGNKTTLICGDINICFKAERNNCLILSLEDWDFRQMNKAATHIAGGHIDHIYINNEVDIDVSLYSPFYCAKDHDA